MYGNPHRVHLQAPQNYYQDMPQQTAAASYPYPTEYPYDRNYHQDMPQISTATIYPDFPGMEQVHKNYQNIPLQIIGKPNSPQPPTLGQLPKNFNQNIPQQNVMVSHPLQYPNARQMPTNCNQNIPQQIVMARSPVQVARSSTKIVVRRNTIKRTVFESGTVTREREVYTETHYLKHSPISGPH